MGWTEDVLYPSAPIGFYVDPDTRDWYQYDGVTVTPLPAGTLPPEAERERFQISAIDVGAESGYRLVIQMKYVGSHRVHYQVDYTATKAGVPTCGLDSEALRPPCVHRNSVPTQSFLVGGHVLGVIDRTHKMTLAEPTTGTAEAWAWRNDLEQHKGSHHYYSGPVSWGS